MWFLKTLAVFLFLQIPSYAIIGELPAVDNFEVVYKSKENMHSPFLSLPLLLYGFCHNVEYPQVVCFLRKLKAFEIL